MFTVNQVLAAPVVVSKDHLGIAEPQAVVINSGVANAATGERGELDALATAAEAGRLLDLDAEEVLVLSTGVIGVLLPLEKVLGGLRAAVPALSPGGGLEAAEAIMTTDTRPKESAVTLDGFTVGGMAKGAGMIHPLLATMLAVVTTDYPLEPGEAIDFLRPGGRPELQLDLGRRRLLDERHGAACSRTAPAASSARRPPTPRSRRRSAASAPSSPSRSSPTARARPCSPRSRSPVPSMPTRRARSRARIATSPLVKTALFGHDPNWGRVLAAAGSAPWNGGFAEVEAERVTLAFNGTTVLERGAPLGVEPATSERRCKIELDLGLGDGPPAT